MRIEGYQRCFNFHHCLVLVICYTTINILMALIFACSRYFIVETLCDVIKGNP
ncbi:MAG: hypothetical protein IGNPGNKH_00077 [Sodalis sp. Ffu]|nr:MAG: hypothetical protein IGNPGNKH_00077 [Sodalis sp. Ffu]